MLRREDDVKKNRGTTSRTRRGQQFDEYFLAVGKKIRGEACPPGWKTIYLNVRENKTLEIPAGASILGAYWGNPRNFGQGKDVTQDIIMSVRRKGQQAFPASTEIFGDVRILYFQLYIYLPSISSYSLTDSHSNSSYYSHLHNAQKIAVVWLEEESHREGCGKVRCGFTQGYDETQVRFLL